MSKNDITGDRLVSKTSTEAYRDGHDRIFGKKVSGCQIITTKQLVDSVEKALDAWADSIFGNKIKPGTTQEAYEQGVVDGCMFQIEKEVHKAVKAIADSSFMDNGPPPLGWKRVDPEKSLKTIEGLKPLVELDEMVKKVSNVAYSNREEFDSEKEMVEHITGQPTPCEHDWCWGGDPGPFEYPVLSCSRCGEEKVGGSLPKPPEGYTAEELERDNPHNQWMYEK